MSKRPAEVKATGVGGMLGVIVVSAIHNLLPSLDWTPEVDAAIVALITALAGPIWARLKGKVGLDDTPVEPPKERPQA